MPCSAETLSALIVMPKSKGAHNVVVFHQTGQNEVARLQGTHGNSIMRITCVQTSVISSPITIELILDSSLNLSNKQACHSRPVVPPEQQHQRWRGTRTSPRPRSGAPASSPVHTEQVWRQRLV